MHKTVKFGVYEKQVRALLGERYDLASFVEGTDYKRFKTGYASRVMFRNGMLEELGGKPAERSEPQAELVETSEPAAQKPVGLQEVIVTRKYPNPRYVETTGGQVFVGGKPVKLGQRIQVCEGKLVIKAASYLG